MILDGGRCPGGAASTVVDLSSPTPIILRPGRSAWNKSWKLCYNPAMLIGIDASRAAVARRTGTETYSLDLIRSLLASRIGAPFPVVHERPAACPAVLG